MLTRCWTESAVIGELPGACRPATRADGYAVQACWAQLLQQEIAGWKIAATSPAGQRHIGVGGPLAGPVFARGVRPQGSAISLAGNRMRVAECEIVFSLAHPLCPRAKIYARDEVLAAVGGVHPGIEVPDSRFREFERAGEAQLIADCACTNLMVLGARAPEPRPDQLLALASLQVQAEVSDGRNPQGIGSNVLGDPLNALVWFVNEITAAGRTLAPGQFVTTGACVPPIPVSPGMTVHADFGWIGRLSASFD